MMGLTPQQSRLLTYIEREFDAGRTPTIDQMRARLGDVSSSQAQATLSALFDRGFLIRDAKSGAIIVNKEEV